MRTLIHVSDLHFGRVDPQLIDPLLAFAHAARPDLVVVSGDLTQRARSVEFAAARGFLDALPTPQIVVPGNHDIPLHNVFNRFVRPLDRYRRYITEDLAPVWQDDEIAVFGINTARSMTIKDGRVSESQLAQLKTRLEALDDRLTKVIVTHHPFDLPDANAGTDLVGRAPAAMQMLAGCGADLLLAGHFHTSHAASSSARYPMARYAALVVQAGTATSTRGRGESNSFNVIRIDAARITVERYSWEAGSGEFLLSSTNAFTRSADVWAPLPQGVDLPAPP